MLDLGKIRDEIDATDDEIVRLFQHRMALTAEVAQYKIETGKAVFDAERERQKLEKLTGEGTNAFNTKGIQELFQQIMSISRKLVWLFHLTTDENYCMEMAKNYMVDYLENVCLRKYEKMNQKERTVRVNIENGPAEEEIGPAEEEIQKNKIQKDEIQRDEVQETEAGTEETPAPVPDHSVVHMQRENRRRERTQNTAKNLAKASAGLAGMDGSKSPEAEEQKDAPEELAKDEMIRQILREFMA